MGKSTKKRNEGKSFEHDIQSSAKAQDLYILRLNDTSLSWQKEKSARFTPSNPADFLLFQEPSLFMIECKSTKGTSISFQRTKEDPKAMIHWDQIQALQYSSTFSGIFGGFLLNFRDETYRDNGITFWVDIEDFTKFIESTHKKSINKQDCIDNNGIIVNQKLKKIHFNYNIDELILEIERRGKNVKTGIQ